MLDYILKVLLFQTMFLAVYDLFLKRETFFQWNRAYLLLTSIMAYVLPFIQIKRVQSFVPDSYQVYLEDVPEMILSPSTIIRDQINFSEYMLIGGKVLFVLGAVVAGILFVFRLTKIIRLIRQSKIEKKSQFYLVWLKETEAYSFFNYIFLGKRMDADTRKQVIAHEMVHVRQKHSIDLLFFEGQKVLAWFNPFSYWYQNRISELHEFIADAKAVKQQNKATYFNHLLVQSFGVADVSFINPFLKASLIKKRILMLNKNKSNQLRKLKYLLLIPMLGGILLYTSCGIAQTTTTTKTEIKKSNDVMLDEIVLGKYFGMTSGLPIEGQKIKFESLTANEKLEYKKWTESTLERIPNSKFEIWQNVNEKKIINHIIVGGIVKKKPKEGNSGREVMFAIIEEAPVHPNCDELDTRETKRCLQEQVKKHVNKMFNVGLAGDLGLTPGRKRVHVQFLIDKNGDIINVRARGPHADLEKEAIRVVQSLPKMKPGKQRGLPVGVRYTLPITFYIADTEIKKSEEIINTQNKPIDGLVSYDNIQEAPIHPDCESTNAEDIKNCTANKIKMHVNRKYNTGLAVKLGLEPGRKRVHVQFKIDKNGDITNVRARGPHEVLEKEAIRVINMLPKMKPGKQDGQAVGVNYTLPITLQIAENNVDRKKMIDSLRVNGPKAYPLSRNENDEFFYGQVSTIVKDIIRPLPGVKIIVKGTSRNVLSDATGTFKIKLNKGEILVFQYKGLSDLEYEFKELNGVAAIMF